MILFRDDWARFPTAIRDYDTTNESFKKLVGLYHRMGIKNCDFCLALYQPDLVGVDPHSPDLTDQQMQMVALETFSNPWYYFREVARIPANAGALPRRFLANRGNIALYWSFFNHVDFGLLQPRQTGKSVSTDVLMDGIVFIWGSNTTVNLITKDDKLRSANVDRLKEIRDLLPGFIYSFNGRTDANNSEMLTNALAGNRYKTAVGRNDKIAADKLGRGLTVPILHFDELAYINLIELSLPVALASGSAARDEARDAKQMYGNIYTTTAGNINSRDGEYAYNFLTSGAVWDEHFFDLANQEELVQVVRKNSRGRKPVIYGAFNHRQLGKDDKWLMQKLEESNQSGEIADRDYLNIWTTGTEGSPLNQEEKKVIKSSEREVKYTEITPDGYVLRWYIDQDEIESVMNSTTPVFGMDPSEMLSEDTDASTLVITHPVTHDTLCVGGYNETNTHQFSKFICNLLIRFPSLILVPERKSMGMAIIDNLLIWLPVKGIDPFKRIYNRIVDDPESHRTEYKEIQKPLAQRPAYFYDRYKKYFGFNTSGGGRNSRDALYGDAFKSAVRLGGRRIMDKTLVNEILSLVIRNGRIDHPNGGHDDTVIAWLLTHWFLTKARNLHFYGIESRRVFSEAIVDPNSLSPQELYRRETQRNTVKQSEQLLEELKDAQDPMVVARLESRLRQLSSQVDMESVSGVGIDAMIKHAQEERAKKIKLNRQQHGSRMGINRYNGYPGIANRPFR